jgi:excisionase family DNA binding protein
MDTATVDDVAQETGVSRETIFRLIRKHKIETYKQLGDRRTYVNRGDIRPLIGMQPRRSRDENHA